MSVCYSPAACCSHVARRLAGMASLSGVVHSAGVALGKLPRSSPLTAPSSGLSVNQVGWADVMIVM